MCWKLCLPNVPAILVGVAALLFAPDAFAQQPTVTESSGVKSATSKAKVSNTVTIKSLGQPVPYATILNVRTGVSNVADHNGIAIVPNWTALDTLQVQSMGYQVVTVVPSNQALGVINLLPQAVQMDEVVVQSNAEVRSAVSISEMESISRMVAKRPVLTVETTGELLEGSGQVHLQMNQQGGMSPVLRGFEANRVLLVVDGVRMNNAIYRAGHLQNAGSVDPFAVHQTQVVMGPSSVLYGSDALGGVVHFVTQRPNFSSGGMQWDGKILTQGSSVNGGWAGHIHAHVKAPRWGSVTNVSHRDFGDLRMGSWRMHGDSTWGLVPFVAQRTNGQDTLIENENPNVQAPTGYSQWDVQQRMRWALREGSLDVNVQHSTTSDVPRFDVQNDLSGGQVKWAEWNYGPQERTMVSTTFSRRIRGGAMWSTLVSYQAIEESRIKRRFGADERITQLEDVDVWGWASVLRGRRGGMNWETGMDGQWNDVVSTATSVNLQTGDLDKEWTRYADGGSSMSTWGVFGAAGKSWGRQTMRAGWRYSHSSVRASFVDTSWIALPIRDVQQSKGAWTEVLLGIPLTPSIQTLTSLASGFRHPNVDDLGKVREKNGFVLVPNPELGPEYLYTAEQGVTWSLKPQSDVLVLQAAAFGSLWKDAIVQADALLNGDSMLVVDGDSARVQMNQNLDRALVRGARVELRARLWPNTTFRGVVNWTKGFSLGSVEEPLAHIPPHVWHDGMHQTGQTREGRHVGSFRTPEGG